MKQLSKVIFVNSANIPHGQVIVDGNVHLIGNQGVGKSTVLRAMLFFYNANTQQLDISPNKKRFKEYYFPFLNSHLVYEVQTENSAYCVWVLKSRNNIAYRFIDKPYHRDFFFDDTNIGRTNKEVEQTLDALGVSYSSRKIERFSEFKDILYGKGQTTFRKYALFQSKVYENIPRTITNIFLNSKLEGNFIKKTIINSIINSEIAGEVDLNVIGTQVSDFQKSYEQISIFKAHEKEGQRIVDIYHTYQNTINQQQTTAEKLGIAVDKAKKEIKILSNNLEERQKSKDKAIQELGELRVDFSEKNNRITKNIGITENNLEQTEKLIRKYKQLKINELIDLNDRKSIVQSDLERSKQALQSLTDKYRNIVEQYKVMFDNLESDKQKFRGQNKETANNLKENWLEQQMLLSNKRSDDMKLINALFEEKIKKASTYQEEVRAIEKEDFIRLELIKQKDFLKNDLEEAKTEIRELEREQFRIDRDLSDEKNKLEHYRNNAIQATEKLKTETDKTYDILQIELTKISDELKTIQNNIEIYQDTIYGFLDKNYENWRDTIGKVFKDEVLLNTDLEPTFETNASAFFGLSINLNHLENQTKRYEDFTKQEQVLIAQQVDLQQKIEKLNTEKIDKQNELKTKHNSKIRKFEQKIKGFEQKVQQIERKIKRLELDLKDLEVDAEKLKIQAIQKETEIWKVTQDDLKTAQLNLNKVQDDKQKERIELDKKYNNILNEKQKSYNTEVEKLKVALKSTLEKFELEKQELEEAQRKSLTDKGAETEHIDIVRKEIRSYEKLLIVIEENFSTINHYQNDKLNYIDKKSTFEYNFQQFTQQLNTIIQTFKTQEKSIENTIVTHEKVIKSIDKERFVLTKDIEIFKRDFELMNEELKQWIIKPSNDWKVKKTFQELQFELEEIKSKLEKSKNQLTTKINVFKSYLKENNKFDLPFHISTFKEYLKFAEQLKKLFDDSMIIALEGEIEKQFSISMNSIVQKTEELSNIKYKVDDVVRQINKNFGDKNFVDAIDKIELQTSASERKIVKKLLDIQQFYNDNGLSTYNIGGLFTSENQTNYSKKAIELLKELTGAIEKTNNKNVELLDAFELEFRIIENNNPTKWVKNLSNVGSNGTDVLAKAMIYIMLLNTFKNKASRKDDNFKIHCIIDEVGILHDINLEGLINFANFYNILLINGSPNANDANAYRYVYQLSKNEKRQTAIDLIMIDGRKA